jgi:hypothetical protein
MIIDDGSKAAVKVDRGTGKDEAVDARQDGAIPDTRADLRGMRGSLYGAVRFAGVDVRGVRRSGAQVEAEPASMAKGNLTSLERMQEIYLIKQAVKAYIVALQKFEVRDRLRQMHFIEVYKELLGKLEKEYRELSL